MAEWGAMSHRGLGEEASQNGPEVFMGKEETSFAHW